MVDLKLVHEMREMGIGWQEITDTVPEASDNTRKLYTGWLEGKKELDTNDIIKNAKTMQNIRLKRKELGIERSINNEQIRDISLHQTFTKDVLQAVRERFNDFRIDNTTYEQNTLEQAHIFTLADYHYDGDETYLEVLNRATKEILKVIKEKGLKNIHLLELGDTIDGASLRNSQLMAIKKGMINQVMEVADAYIKMLTYLSEFVHVRFIAVDSSNHTQLRNLGTKQNQLIEEDLMQILNKMIEVALPNLDFVHGKEVFETILGFNCFIAHSHEVRGSAIKYIKDVTTHRDRLIDFSFFGHRHHMEVTDINSTEFYDKQLFYCPSLSTKLSQYEKQHNLSSKAGVGYFVLDEGKGCVEIRKLIV